ncbi:MAG: 3-deoxy-D-manno-octulosonic acid transferase [Acidobacteriota bacterium]|nr:MAG: 3-deoxy-D-manno-octulosonic acid transferase [Acidobacteriota bacterium]
MYVIYSLVYTLGFILMMPVFLLRRGKYLSGFRQRFGRIEGFRKDARPVIWIHCVSVGETNAARPLVKELKELHPSHRIVVSTVTKTGQELARHVFADTADLVFYLPFDWKFTVLRALRAIRPNIVLVLETEIWFNFFREVHRRGIVLAIVNGRLSEKSARKYRRIPKTIRRVLRNVDLVLAQSGEDAERFKSLGVRKKKIKVTGNIKNDQEGDGGDATKLAYIRERFSIDRKVPFIVAASTHKPEEEYLLEALRLLRARKGLGNARMLIAPRHPERFDEVAELIDSKGYTWARRSANLNLDDGDADIVLLDSIGELRSAYPLANLVFVGGSLIRHGGQNFLEPALERKAIVTGPYLHNFASAAKKFSEADAFVKLEETSQKDWPRVLDAAFFELLSNGSRREELGRNAFAVANSNRGATKKTIEILDPFLKVHSGAVNHAEAAVAG